jgi:ubiquitin carboxyl-terminal hydrolase L5
LKSCSFNSRKPIYGLIFLYQYNDNEEEEDQIKCPNHVWFANQVGTHLLFRAYLLTKRKTIHNACATIALMNIVMNVKEIDLGDALTSFKTATKKLKPPYRGQRLGKDDFIRRIHNSFAR